MEEAQNAVIALRELDKAMHREQPDRARGLGFVVEPPSDEVGVRASKRGSVFPSGCLFCALSVLLLLRIEDAGCVCVRALWIECFRAVG